jgi:hypothetical protein
MKIARLTLIAMVSATALAATPFLNIGDSPIGSHAYAQGGGGGDS